ncbi:MAG: hypothetical protein WCA06_20145 [Terrimicrobiaceae bacterium]
MSSGNGGVHRLFEISNANKAVLVDTQNQKGGVSPNPPPDRPDTGLITAPPPPTSGGGGGSTGGSGSGTGGGGGVSLPTDRPDTGLISAPNRPPTTGGGGGSTGGSGSGTGGVPMVERVRVAAEAQLVERVQAPVEVPMVAARLRVAKREETQAPGAGRMTSN